MATDGLVGAAVEAYLRELRANLWHMLPDTEIDRLIEETSDHLQSVAEELGDDVSVSSLSTVYGDPRTLALQCVEAWYNRRAGRGAIERFFGPADLRVLGQFGIANLFFWVLLQLRVFLPTNAPLHSGLTPAAMRRIVPEPLPFPEFSIQFLLLTGIPLLAPPIIGWLLGRQIPIRPHLHVYRVLMPITILSFIIGISLLPITDGLLFAIVQAVYWVPVGCASAAISAELKRRGKLKLAWRSAQNGFTLMELLVVMVIVGTLAALLFPALAKAKNAAERTTCMVNSRELGLATIMYADDFDDRVFPFGYYAGNEFITWWGDLFTGAPEQGILYPYTRSKTLRACPAAFGLENDLPYIYRMGYGMNFRLFYQYEPEPSPWGYRTVNVGAVERPIETILFADNARWHTERKMLVSSPWLFGDSPTNHMQARHAGGMTTVGWMDGHVSSERLSYSTKGDGYDYGVTPELLKANGLGDLTKYPREDFSVPSHSLRDQFYYLLQKPAGL